MDVALSVVVPFYGEPAATMPLVEALLAQATPTTEVIVADDASPIPFPELTGVKVIQRTTNGGFGSAVNTGAQTATGDWLLILNSDLEISPTFLKDFTAAAQPWMPAVLGPCIVNGAGQIEYTARRYPTVSHQVAEWLTPLARFKESTWWHRAVGHDHRDAHPSPTDWLVGAVLLLPLAEFRAVGGFDEGYFMNVEEVDLQRRLRQRGLPSVRLPQVIVKHEGGGSSDPAKRRRWIVSARTRYARKWGGLTRLRLGLTAATTTNFVWNSARAVLGRPTHPVQTAREELDLIWRT